MINAQLPDADAIRAAFCRAGRAAIDVHAFSELGSTSAWLREQRGRFGAELEQGRAQVCVTDWQQSGEGRRGRQFHTQPGNLTFSVLSRVPVPAVKLVGLSLVTGIAVADALENALGIRVMLKWPNDVILHGLKLGGLLTELISLPSGKPGTEIITGIGINVLHDEALAALGIGATALKTQGIDVPLTGRDALVGEIGAHVLEFHERFMVDGWTTFALAWQRRDWLEGKAVTVHTENASEPGIARGVNDDGALLVECAGKIQALYGGNISIRPVL